MTLEYGEGGGGGGGVEKVSIRREEKNRKRENIIDFLLWPVRFLIKGVSGGFWFSLGFSSCAKHCVYHWSYCAGIKVSYL